jgi:RNA polymerase sigma factor (sigma-70 family)
MMEAASTTTTDARSAGLPVGLGLLGDERLARMVSSGSERAFAELFERYHQPLYRYCRSIVRDDCDAQDALQSAFTGALAALRRGQRDAPLRPWLFRIAHNESISLIRRRRGGEVELSAGVEPGVVSTEERFAERERLALLVADLQQLPDRQRGALVMRELSGLSHEEIAVALGTSVGGAKQAVFEARSALLEFAEGRAMGCEEARHAISDGDRRVLRGRRVRAHLRDCAPCAAFAAAIPARSADLKAFALPLAPVAAAGVVGRVTGRAAAHPAAGAGGVATTAAGKIAGAGLATKALVAAAVVTGTAAGVTGVLRHTGHARLPPVSARVTTTSASARTAGSASTRHPATRKRGVHRHAAADKESTSGLRAANSVGGQAATVSLHLGASRGAGAAAAASSRRAGGRPAYTGAGARRQTGRSQVRQHHGHPSVTGSSRPRQPPRQPSAPARPANPAPTPTQPAGGTSSSAQRPDGSAGGSSPPPAPRSSAGSGQQSVASP